MLTRWAGLAGAGHADRLAESMLNLCVDREWLRGHPELIAELADSSAVHPVGFMAKAQAITHDTRDRLDALRLPALILVGDGDRVTDPSHGTWIARALPQARLLTLSTGHVPFWERPGEVASAIAEFAAGL